MDLPALEAQIEVGPAECAICYEDYRTSSKSREPKTLQCGHKLCLNCLSKLVCHSLLITFVVCPFCRSVTVVPEEGGIQALKTDEETLSRASLSTVINDNFDDAHSLNSGHSSGRLSPTFSEDPTQSPRLSIFTVTDVLVPDQGQLWGGRYMHEVRSTYLLGITRRVALSEAHPSPTSTSFSVHSLRLCLALALIVSLACVFIILMVYT